LVLVGDAATGLAEPVRETLRLAGAEIVLTARLPRGREAIGSISAGGSPTAGRAPSAGPTEAERVAAALTRALVTGQSGLLEGVRARSPELEVTGDLHTPVRRLLLLCTNEDPEYARGVAAGRGVEPTIARVATERDALLVVAEPEAPLEVGASATESPAGVEASRRAPTSLLPALAGLGATTIDHLDTAAGQIAMVRALGSARGRFGTGPGASRVLPPMAPP
jgi:hypothetical protein